MPAAFRCEVMEKRVGQMIRAILRIGKDVVRVGNMVAGVGMGESSDEGG